MESKILKNSSYILFAQVITKIISFFYTIYLANILGVANFGLYYAALAYFSLVSSFADLGFNRFLIREGAKDEQKLQKYLGATILIRLLLNLVIFVGLVWLLMIFDNDPQRKYLSIWALLAVVPQSIALTFDAALVAKQNFKLSAIGLIGLSVLTTLFGFFLAGILGSLGAVYGLVLGQFCYCAILFIFILMSQIKPTLFINPAEIKLIIKGSVPYGILLVLGFIYFKIDGLMLVYLRGPTQTGIYGAAYKFLDAIVFVPSAIATALFPVIAQLEQNNYSKIKSIYISSLKLLGFLSIPVFLGYYFIAPLVIPWLLPQYLQSIDALKILSFTIPFMFLHVPAPLILMSFSKYLKPMIYLSIFTVSFNIVANLILIPQFGFTGAAYTTVISEALSFVVFFGLIYQKVLRHA